MHTSDHSPAPASNANAGTTYEMRRVTANQFNIYSMDGHYLGQAWGHKNGYTALPMGLGHPGLKKDCKSYDDAAAYLADFEAARKAAAN